MFTNRVAVVTGGAQGIGQAIGAEFRRAGALVCIIDQQPNDYFVGDLGSQADLEDFARKVIADYGRVDYLVHNAPPLMKGISACSYEEFNYALRVGVTAPFYLTKLLAPYFAPGAAVVNIASSRDRMSQPQTESYTAAKGGIAALTHALAMSLAGKARVNSISPGWIDTAFTQYEGPDALQHPAGRVGTLCPKCVLLKCNCRIIPFCVDYPLSMKAFYAILKTTTNDSRRKLICRNLMFILMVHGCLRLSKGMFLIGF